MYMKLKKINAGFSLLTIVLFFIHTSYQAFSFLTHNHNVTLTMAFGYLLLASVSVHAVLGCIMVFGKHDAKIISYPALNIQTMLQRISMVVISVFLIPHILSFLLLPKAAGGFFYYLLEIIKIIFYAAVFTHIAVSFGKALITLGLLSEPKTKKAVDIVMTIICTACFIALSIIITVTHAGMYGG